MVNSSTTTVTVLPKSKNVLNMEKFLRDCVKFVGPDRETAIKNAHIYALRNNIDPRNVRVNS